MRGAKYMMYNERDVIRVAEENGIMFAELMFCNVTGRPGSVTLPAS